MKGARGTCENAIKQIVTLFVLLTLSLAAGPADAAPHWEADISWTQPAPTTQTGYRIERKFGATGTYVPLTTSPLGAAVRTFRDVGPYTDDQLVCWRAIALGGPATSAATSAITPMVTGGPTRIYSTIYSIGVEWDITNDPNHNATVGVQYRVQGTSPWKPASPGPGPARSSAASAEVARTPLPSKWIARMD